MMTEDELLRGVVARVLGKSLMNGQYSRYMRDQLVADDLRDTILRKLHDRRSQRAATARRRQQFA